MIVGIGVDICRVRRMERELAREDGGFRDGVFTSAEIAYCSRQRYPARHFAARFAAKESIWKALGTGAPDTGALREAELRVTPGGAPHLEVHGRLRAAAAAHHVARIFVSVSHSRNMAVATVVLEADGPVAEVAHAEL
jgi:holo-[acyl-carrier protein] synthase